VATVAAPAQPLALKVPLTVKELAEKIYVSPGELIKHLLGMKVLATINQLLTEEPVEKLLKIYGYRYERMQTLEEKIEAEHEEEDPSSMKPRPPVVTFMGHVDHGKTSLLDAIRQTRVVEGEAGGITQHIGAYRVMLPKGTIAFLDTPGHEAFTAMRARGANATDIVVLVVAADDGMMPQTEEALDHARAAEATIVVALNKMDKPSANPERVKKQLMEHGLMSEEWGGKTIVVPVSAKTGAGIDQLLEAILLEAEVLELKADPTRAARGVVLEGKLTKGGGPVAHVLVQNGTLRVGDAVVSGTAWGKVRAMLDARGHRLEEAGPSTPVELLGLGGVPKAGDTFLTAPDQDQAREIALARQEQFRESKEPVRRAVTLEEFHKQMEAGKLKSLNLILKADVQGSAEALRGSLDKLPTDRASLKFLHVAVGAVNESDILLAEASSAVVIGFNVQMTPEAEVLAKEEQVDVRLYRIIYEAVNDITAALEGLLEPKLVEQSLGRAKVLQVFRVTKVGAVAGCQVVKGKILRNAQARVWRGQEKLHQGKIETLKRFKDDVKEVTEGIQCGLSVAGFSDYQPDDVIEAFEVQQVAQKL
jgi:translation initiation factor IF-2